MKVGQVGDILARATSRCGSRSRTTNDTGVGSDRGGGGRRGGSCIGLRLGKERTRDKSKEGFRVGEHGEAKDG